MMVKIYQDLKYLENNFSIYQLQKGKSVFAIQLESSNDHKHQQESIVSGYKEFDIVDEPHNLELRLDVHQRA
jgi:hypothetical protein